MRCEFLIANGKLRNVRFSNVQAPVFDQQDGLSLVSEDMPSNCEEIPTVQDDNFVGDQTCSPRDEQDELMEQDPLCEQEWDCVEDCLLSHLSCESSFDEDTLFGHAESVLTRFLECDNVQKRNVIKSRIVTLFFRQSSSHSSLKETKQQASSFLEESDRVHLTGE